MHFRDKAYEHEFWASCIQKYEKLQKGLDLMSSMDSDYLQPRGREVLMHILTKRVLEMSSHGMEGKVEGVTYPLESIWWHPALNLSDEEWDSLVYWLPVHPKDR